MSPEHIMGILQLLGPAVAAFLAVHVGIAVATEKADAANKSAARAHVRLDDHLTGHK